MDADGLSLKAKAAFSGVSLDSLEPKMKMSHKL